MGKLPRSMICCSAPLFWGRPLFSPVLCCCFSVKCSLMQF